MARLGSGGVAGERREAGGFQTGIARPSRESLRRIGGFLGGGLVLGARHNFDGLGGNVVIWRLARPLTPDARTTAAPAAPPPAPIAIRLVFLVAALARFPDRRLARLRALARCCRDRDRRGAALASLFGTPAAATPAAATAFLFGLLIASLGGFGAGRQRRDRLDLLLVLFFHFRFRDRGGL